ncbi:hypothetical protein SI91_04480 [Akkermansia muciniphila]|nr:hypothetical protein [Akkermansia muciniphila]MCO6193377.1 hypothetical protein [Akkermansia muciniphila]MCO6195304.1 hypothetical protein [Akkermansia muciniphila]MCO6197229.1 hypothetical protein [Akkermansia muciniphila]
MPCWQHAKPPLNVPGYPRCRFPQIPRQIPAPPHRRRNLREDALPCRRTRCPASRRRREDF